LEDYKDSAEPIEDGAYWIEPRLREEMLVMREEEGAGRAILRPVALKLEEAYKLSGRGVPE
jgi:hypothetical protein